MERTRTDIRCDVDSIRLKEEPSTLYLGHLVCMIRYGRLFYHVRTNIRLLYIIKAYEKLKFNS